MRLYLILLFLTAAFFEVNAQADTGTTRPLRFNNICIKKDDSNISVRKQIYDAEAYAYMQTWSTCDIDSFPPVNFKKQLLLFVSYTYSGCESNVDRKMLYSIDHVNKKLILHLIVYEQGICRPGRQKSEFFPIPIIPKSYSIELYKPYPKIPEIIPGVDE